MFAVLGATGKVGFATIRRLRAAGRPVRAIVRSSARAQPLLDLGCELATADCNDTEALVQAFDGVQAVQVVCPPQPRSLTPAKDMRKTASAIATAIKQTQPRHVLMVSDYGAGVTDDIGMPSVFRDFEMKLVGMSGSLDILRSAEHMQNWLRLCDLAKANGTLPSLHHPIDRPFAIVSAQDVGVVAGDLLLADRKPDGARRVTHVEGPSRYCASEVAQVLSERLQCKIAARELPRDRWYEVLTAGGMSVENATLIAATQEAHNSGLVDVEAGVGPVKYGPTTLLDALASPRLPEGPSDPVSQSAPLPE